MFAYGALSTYSRSISITSPMWKVLARCTGPRVGSGVAAPGSLLGRLVDSNNEEAADSNSEAGGNSAPAAASTATPSAGATGAEPWAMELPLRSAGGLSRDCGVLECRGVLECGGGGPSLCARRRIGGRQGVSADGPAPSAARRRSMVVMVSSAAAWWWLAVGGGLRATRVPAHTHGAGQQELTACGQHRERVARGCACPTRR